MWIWTPGVRARLRSVSLTLALVGLGGGIGCGKVRFDADTRGKYEVAVRVTSGPEKPIAGVELQHAGAKVAVTDAKGSAIMQFVGNEGDSYDLRVQCPAGLVSPLRPVRVTLRRMATPGTRPEVAATCAPASRVVVVAVRAENGANLPVLYLGNEVARTDAAGAAHVALRLAPGETFDLSLGTTEKGAERLRPQNPSFSHAVKDRDEVVPFDQRFSLEPTKAVRMRAAPTGPQPL